jgi:hypothetical protein
MREAIWLAITITSLRIQGQTKTHEAYCIYKKMSKSLDPNHIEKKSWVRIQIRTETHGDPQHCKKAKKS